MAGLMVGVKEITNLIEFMLMFLCSMLQTELFLLCSISCWHFWLEERAIVKGTRKPENLLKMFRNNIYACRSVYCKNFPKKIAQIIF